MADEQLESGLEVKESKAPPMPEISEPSGDERPSAAAVDAEALADQLTERVLSKLDEVIDRRLQSTKDKRLSALDNLDAEALRRFNAYVKKFGDEDEAVRQMKIDTLIQKQASPVADQARSARAETRDTTVILTEVKNDLGIDIAPDDPDLMAAAKKTYASWDSWRAEVMKLGARRAKQATAPVSAVVAETPQSPPSGASAEVLTEQLNRAMADRPSAKNTALIKELRSKLAAEVAKAK